MVELNSKDKENLFDELPKHGITPKGILLNGLLLHMYMLD
jgi:hypothetical protein